MVLHRLTREIALGSEPDNRITIMALGLTILGFASNCQALDAVLGGDVNPAAEFNTNIFMSRNQSVNIGKDVWGEGIDGGLNLALSDRLWKVNANSRFQNRWYQDDNNLDYFNQLFSTKSQYNYNERSFLGLDAQYNMDHTLSTDSSADLGYSFRRVPRTTRSISPNWSYSLTESLRLALSYTYQDTTYDRPNSGIGGNYVDSAAHIGALNLTHQWNDKLQLLGSLNYTSYDLIGNDRSFPGLFLGFIPTVFTTQGVTSTIETASFMTGFSYNPTDTTTLSFSGGGQHNRVGTPEGTVSITNIFGNFEIQRIPALASSSFSEILAASASKKFEQSDISFNFSRSISPNLQGSLILYDRYSFDGNYKFSKHLSSSLNISLSDQTSNSGLSNVYDREIFSARTGINWQWDENWLLNASYIYRRIDYPSTLNSVGGGLDASSPDSHALYLNIRYLFDKYQF